MKTDLQIIAGIFERVGARTSTRKPQSVSDRTILLRVRMPRSEYQIAYMFDLVSERLQGYIVEDGVI